MSTSLYIALAAVLALVVGVVVGRLLAGKARQDHDLGRTHSVEEAEEAEEAEENHQEKQKAHR